MYKKKKMTLNEAEKISNWHYQPPYDFYNNNGNEETIQEFLEHDYQLVVDDADRIIGFYCTGSSAQVSAGHETHCYPAGFLDVGLGLHPDLTGRGMGSMFMNFILNEIGGQPLRLTVADFNQRAIRLYKKFGFEEVNRFKTGETSFVVMINKKHLKKIVLEDTKEYQTKEQSMETVAKELNLYIVRHGETEWNKLKRFQGSLDSPLTETGLKQAAVLGERLKEVKWDAIYASPLGRAHKTAEIINVNREPMILMDELKEMNFGDWEGQLHKDLALNEPLRFEQFWQEPADFTTMVGEDFYQVKDRSIKALKKIIREHPAGNVLIVTHTVIVKSMMAFFEDRELEAFWNPPFIGACSLSQVKLVGDEVEIILHADSSHV